MCSLTTCLYIEQNKNWPEQGKHILANFDDNTIVVYQAYKPQIAEAILKNKNLNSEECIRNGYNLNRMSWIKTNFLWMMYRSGWASKRDQERILAFRIKRSGFEEILSKAVLSSHSADKPIEHKSADVILQWDPDHNPNGSKVETGRRAIQLGLRGETLLKFSNSFIVDVYDVTDFVKIQFLNCKKDNKEFDDLSKLEIPLEKIYIPENPIISQHISLSI